MGYSSTAINSAMSKSLLFNNIIGENKLDASNDILKIGTFNSEGFYKISLSSASAKMYVNCEIANKRIISAQSVYSDDEIYSNSIEGFMQNPEVAKEFGSFYLSSSGELYFKLNSEILIEGRDFKEINCSIDYFNGDFETVFSIQASNTELSSVSSLSVKVNQTAFGIPISTEKLALEKFKVEDAITERLYAKEIYFGNWKLCAKENDDNTENIGDIVFTLADENPWKVPS